MAKQLSDKGTANIKDFRRKLEDGSENPNFGKELTVDYDYSYKEYENDNEVSEDFSPADLRKLANQRAKATANSTARQKATAIYAMADEDLAREEMIKGAMKLNKKLTREQAEAYVDSLSAM